MNTFLPNSYVFSSQKALTPDQVYTSDFDISMQQCSAVLQFAFVIACILVAVLIVKIANNNDNNHDPVTNFLWKFPFAFAMVMVLFFAGHYIFTGQRPYENTCDFGLYTKTNLIVRQDNKKYPHSATDRKSYPYKFYVKNIDGDPDKKKHLLYLGKAKNNKIFLANKTAANKLFINYFYYVKKHHLEDKFGNELYFEKDPNTTNTNGVPQYVLKGDGITLKIKPDKKQSYHIYAEKS